MSRMNGTEVEELVFSPSTLKRLMFVSVQLVVLGSAAALVGLLPSAVLLGMGSDMEIVAWFLAWFGEIDIELAAELAGCSCPPAAGVSCSSFVADRSPISSDLKKHSGSQIQCHDQQSSSADLWLLGSGNAVAHLVSV